MTDLSIVREFGAQLRQAEDPPRRWRATAALPVAALALVALVGLFSSGEATEPALAVERGAGSVTIELRQPSASIRQLTRELQDAGVRGQIVAVPTSKRSVGKWVAATRAANQKPALAVPPNAKPISCPDFAAAKPVAGAAVNGTTMTVPAAAADRGAIVLLVGRQAAPTEARFVNDAASHNGDGDIILRCSA